MLVLSSTIASRYYNCCTDGSTSPTKNGKCGKRQGSRGRTIQSKSDLMLPHILQGLRPGKFSEKKKKKKT
jgi:hypothetical protein